MEKFPPSENKSEHVPRKDDVLDLVRNEIPGGDIDRVECEEYDSDGGLFRFDVRAGNVGYEYMRKGNRGPRKSPTESIIYMVFYEGDTDTPSGENPIVIATYNHETGEWEK